ncbi:M56 family metallopeptidase [Mucilaginibacter corticis]|uniref:M56 family metallopeptidase n=1 Tax=Mucilaginibacter corticis TaxID=2597670 RepID=A0A556MHZ0_9SPHI|nr:M56 family metallopeptidase [Mucilaginibacter corticis]TSJ39524.1 M56 family metallopeptidase [Mucilaginibacter corticis]
MPALFVFLLKVNIALLVFCLGYYLVLRKLTFYTLNRVYLVLAILISSVYPVININNFAQQHRQLIAPVQKVAINWQMPAQRFAEEPAYWYWAGILFWLGAIVFAAKLAMQLLSLYRLYRNSSPGKIQDHAVRITAANVSPFSFWQNIYINPDNVETKDLKSILQHEQVHVNQWHTLDILLAEISVIFYWFNPGVWFMKKAVRENIEFITDRKILQKGTDSKAYQYSLLNVSIAATASAGITNHFNFSTLKKRIKMMNAKRSSNLNLTRYAFLVPAVLICLFVFSISKAELVKNTKVTYKKVAASVNNLVSAAAQQSVIIKKKFALTDTNKKIRKDVTYRITTDTGVHKSFSYSQHGDSSAYYVDGKKVTKEEFQKLQPGGDFQNMQVMDDHVQINPDGKKINVVKVNGKVIVVNRATVHPVIIKSGKDSIKTNVVYTVRTDDDSDSDSKTGTKVYKSNINYTYSTDDKNDAAKQKTIDVVLSPPPGQTDFNNKLILINGKEADARKLKKLSASDIETVTPCKGQDEDPSDGITYIKKYGDKAKNGVTWITTKKNK